MKRLECESRSKGDLEKRTLLRFGKYTEEKQQTKILVAEI